MEILAHRGHWCGIKGKQNKTWAIRTAFEAGFGAELDLRFKDGKTWLSHDELDMFLPQIHRVSLAVAVGKKAPKRRFKKIAFHIKDNALLMLPELIKHCMDRDCFFFGLTSEEQEEYAKVFGWERIAYEIEPKNAGSDRAALENKCGVVWILAQHLINLEYISSLHAHGKKAYVASWELSGYRPEQYITLLRDRGVDGFCTDFPNYYKYLLDVTYIKEEDYVTQDRP